MKENQELFICRCHNKEHQLIFSYWDDIDEVYMTVHLAKVSFWKRLKNALKYIFGYSSCYGDFDEFIFQKEDSEKLQRIINFLNKNNENN